MADTWEDLERACGQCRGCSLWEGRKHVVFDAGSRTAEVMRVGEGPGATEDEQGIPFVGRAGQLLDKLLAAVDLDREKESSPKKQEEQIQAPATRFHWNCHCPHL